MKRHRKTRVPCYSTRNPNGNVMLLVGTGLAVIIVAILASLVCSGLFLNQSAMESNSESFALESALKLNSGDYAGRVNLLTAHSRELVHDSRQLKNKVNAQMPELGSLADRLMEESRQGSKLMESERQLLGSHIVNELCDTSKKFAKKNSVLPAVPIVAGNVSGSNLVNLEIGDIEGLPSNVETSKANQSLWQYDAQMGYVQPAADLYRSNVNLKLPNEDADLNFELSALPAQIDPAIRDTTAAPNASLYKAATFRRTAFLWKDGMPAVVNGAKIPSAIRCAVASEVNVNAGKGLHGDMHVTGITAATNGTNPEH